MGQYLLKRLLLMGLTLFGIALLSFVIMTLAPGDPAAMKGQGLKGNTAINEFTIKKNRELFFLDRPLVLNLSPATRTSAVAAAVADLDSPIELERRDARTELTSVMGTAALEGLAAALPARAAAVAEARAALEERYAALERALAGGDDAALTSPLRALAEAHPAFEPRLELARGEAPAPRRLAEVWRRQRAEVTRSVEAPAREVLAALSSTPEWPEKTQGILPPDRGGPDVTASTPLDEAVARWGAFWAEHAGRYTPQAGAAAAEAWLAAAELGEAERAALREVGQLAAPTLMGALLGAREGSARELRAAEGLVLVLKKPWGLIASDEERERLASAWKEERARIEADKEQFPGSYQRRLAALGTEQEYVDRELEVEMGRRRAAWREWWYRAEENYVDFSAGRQLGRAFSQTQFGRWLSRFARFDFGESYIHKKPVSELLWERLKVTIPLNVVSLALTFLIAIPVGIYSAVRRGSLGDQATTLTLFVLYSIPSFWMGAMLLMLLTGEPFLNLFPAYGIESLDADKLTRLGRAGDWVVHGTLPVICLTYGYIAYIARQMRGAMLETVRKDYIRTARAKGLPERVVVLKHALRNSLIPIVTLMGALLPAIFAGSVIVESIFTLPGLGKLAFDAILQRDYPVIMANLVISGFLTLVGYLLSDIAYALVDPRIEYR